MNENNYNFRPDRTAYANTEFMKAKGNPNLT